MTGNATRITRTAQVSIARGATAALWGAIGLAALILALAVSLRWHRHLPDLEDLRWRTLLTALGIAAGAWLARPIIVAARKVPWTVPLVGIVAVVVSQTYYYVLVWGKWKSTGWLWRAWWISLVIAVGIAHASWVRLLIGQPPVRQWVWSIARIVWVCIFAGAVLCTVLVLGRTPLPDTSAGFQWAVGIAAGLGAVGTIILVFRAWKLRAREATTAQKTIWLGVGATTAVAIGFYVGRITAPTSASFESMPAILTQFSVVELDNQLTGDLRRLQIVAAGLDELVTKSRLVTEQVRANMKAEKRDYFRPAEEDQIRAMFMSYLACRAALLRMVAIYNDFHLTQDPSLRARSFLVGYAAGTTVMQASQQLVGTYGNEPAARRKLNEPDAACGLPADTFDRISAAVTNPRNIGRIDEMAGYFLAHRDNWRHEQLMPGRDFEWLDQRIRTSLEGIRYDPLTTTGERVKQLYRTVQRDVYAPIYASQSIVSTLIGDTRMVSRPPFISLNQVRQLQQELRPGDVFLERRNWFMSNAFLPGFWPHAALYVGTIHDLETLGLVRRAGDRWTSDQPAIRDRLEEFLKPAEDRELHTVIESVSEGVVFNSLTHSMHADYVAVLRPRKLSDADRARAIARAFGHVGKPYDFEFDFFSADKLVCTELVYRSYDGMIKFDLVPIMGRSTLPALEIARKFSAERERDDRDFDFVLFLDAVPQENAAKRATIEAFCGSVDRPRGFNE